MTQAQACFLPRAHALLLRLLLSLLTSPSPSLPLSLHPDHTPTPALPPCLPACLPPSQVRCQRVIYGLLEDVGSLLVGASPKVEHEVVAGTAEVLQVFQLKGNRWAGLGWLACVIWLGSATTLLWYPRPAVCLRARELVGHKPWEKGVFVPRLAAGGTPTINPASHLRVQGQGGGRGGGVPRGRGLRQGIPQVSRAAQVNGPAAPS